LLGVMLGLLACTSVPSTSNLTPVTIQLAWTHSAQFAGFYADDQNGYYADAGLDVTFIEGGTYVERLPTVLEGKAQFGLASGVELILARANGQPVQAIATILRQDPFAFFSLAGSNITRPQDFAGKTVQIRTRSLPILRAVTEQVGLPPDAYTEDYEALFEDLYTGNIDVAVGFVTAQLLEAEQAGYKLNVIYPDDYGVHLYSDVIFATDEFIADNPTLVTQFLQATFKGWTYAVENPDEMGALVVQHSPNANAQLENAKMLVSLPLVNTGQNHIGWMETQVWNGMANTLREQGVLTQTIVVSQVYTTQFLQEIYPP